MARVRWATRSGLRSSVKIPGGEAIRALIEPLPGQKVFLDAFDQRLKKIVAYRAGIGAGKSWIGAHYSIEKAARNPTARGFIGANTYTQLWQTTLSGLYEVCAAYGVPVHPKKPEAAAKKKVLYLWGKVEVLCRAAENKGYKQWDGFKCGWFWLDEPKDMDQDAYRTICERHRDGRVDVLQGWLTSSPSWGTWFNDIDEDPDVVVVNATTKENFHNPPDYVTSLLSKMGAEMVEQQIEGKVVNVGSGRCYPCFSRIENAGRQLSLVAGQEIIIGVDFNVDPGMHAYAMQFDSDDVLIFDEIYIRGGDTPALAREIETRYGTEGVIIHPDAAGGHRSTTGTSDHQILREAGFKIRCRAKNPPIKNRINAYNGRILNALGERHLFIDPACKLLRKDLEQCTWEVMANGAYKGPLTHPGAATGYAIEYKFPWVGGGFVVSLPKRSFN